MKTLELAPNYLAEPGADGSFEDGEIYHFIRNSSGHGGTLTPIARFHVWRPQIGAEGFNPHQRVDCYVRDGYELAPDPAWLTRMLADALARTGAVREPVWLGWHVTKELGGEPRGDVFELD